MKTNIILSLSLFLLFMSCTNAEKEATKETPKAAVKQENNLVQFTAEQNKIAGITTGTPGKRGMSSILNVNGLVDVPPENVFSISIPLGGYIRKTNLIPGMMVRKGAVLATIEDQQYVQLQQDYLMAKNKLKFAEADYIRQKGLNATKATSDKLFQQTESDFNQQKIMVKSLAEQLQLIGLNPLTLTAANISRRIQIYSPIDGHVTKVNVNTGKYVNATDVLFELINPKKLHVNLTVLENDASSLKEGQKIVCTTNRNPDKKYLATIHLISPAIGEDRSISVYCDLENYGKELLPGTYLNAAVKLNHASVTAVPDEAVVKWENKFYVFTDEGNHQYKMIGVEPGILSEGFTEIKSPLPAKKIVMKNAYAILMKMKNGGEEGE